MEGNNDIGGRIVKRLIVLAVLAAAGCGEKPSSIAVYCKNRTYHVDVDEPYRIRGDSISFTESVLGFDGERVEVSGCQIKKSFD